MSLKASNSMDTIWLRLRVSSISRESKLSLMAHRELALVSRMTRTKGSMATSKVSMMRRDKD